MSHNTRRAATITIAAFVSLGFGVVPAFAAAGDSSTDPIIVTSPRDVPEGSIADPISTWGTPQNDCDSTRSWTNTTPAKDAVSHDEYRYLQVIKGSEAVTHEEVRYSKVVPAIPETFHNEFSVEQRTRVLIPGSPAEAAVTSPRWGVDQRTREVVPAIPATDEVSHLEYGSQERTRDFKPGTPGQDAVTHMEYKYQRQVAQTKTEYQWEKHVSGVIESFVDGKWKVTGSFANIDYPGAGPVWADGGSGGHNSIFNDSGSKRYRSTSYTYVKTGVTREVPNGTKTETSDWLLGSPGAGWTKIDTRTVTDKEAVPATPDSYSDWSGWVTKASGLASPPVLKSNTNTREFRQLTPVKVVDKEATPGTPAGYTDWSDWKSIATGLKADPTDTLDRNTKVQEKRVVKEADGIDKEAVPAGPDTYSDWSDWNVLASGLLEDPTNTLDRNTKLQEKRVQTTKVSNGDGVAAKTVYYSSDSKTPVDAEADATYEANAPEGDWSAFGEPKIVTDQDAVADKTVYYVQDGVPSDLEADASWIKDMTLEGWTQFDKRNVVDAEAVPASTVYYAYSDGILCEVVVPPVVTPPVVVPPVVVVTPPVVVPPVVTPQPIIYTENNPSTIYTENNVTPTLVTALRPGYAAPRTGGAGYINAAPGMDRLPTTGSGELLAITATAAALMTLGGGLVLASRRRRTNQI